MHPRTGGLLTKPYEAVLVYAMNVLFSIVVVEFVFGELHSKKHVRTSVMLRGGGSVVHLLLLGGSRGDKP